MSFDPQTFMNQTVDEPLKHVRELCPEGDYKAFVGDYNFDNETFRTITVKKGTPEEREATILRLPIRIEDEDVRKKLQRDTVTVFYRDCWLDFKPGTNELDTGANKNIDLGRICKATGISTGAIFTALRGAGPILARVRHRQYDENDPEKKLAEVVSVAPWKD